MVFSCNVCVVGADKSAQYISPPFKCVPHPVGSHDWSNSLELLTAWSLGNEFGSAMLEINKYSTIPVT